MSETGSLAFVALVQEKYDEARNTEGCVIRHQRRGRPVERVQLVDPQSNVRHAIQRQKRSHILETQATNPIRTPLTECIGVIVDPQRLLVDNGGDVKLISRRETLFMSGSCLGDTMESLKRSEPFPVNSVGAISVANSMSSYDESLARLLVSRTGTLQERAQALLRSGFISRRYCEIEWVEIDQEEFPDAPNGFRVISAKFTNEGSGMKGTLSNTIEPNLKALSSDSTEIGLEFQSEAMLPTLDGNVFGRDFNISVEGDNAFIHAPTPAGFTHLAPESLAMIGEIIDTATLMPYRSN